MERLDDVVVRAGAQPVDLVLPAIARGQNQDRVGLALLAQLADHVEPGHLRQPQIHDGEIDRVLEGEVQALLAVGGLLAIAGVLMQVLLRNPLAEPYILGTSGGAAVAALLAILFGLSSLVVDFAAFAGAMAATLIVFSIAHGTGAWTPTRLLLTGVVLAAGFSAATTLLLALSPDQQLRGMLFWLMGDLAYARSPWPALTTLLALSLLLLPLGRSLNAMARGPLQAAALGVAVKPMEWSIYIAASLLTALAVTTAGSIGFVGLVVPHMLRLILGNDQRLILPACALAGGALLTLADTLARTIIAPEQLPVGVITALLGVPTFLLLLYRSR